MAFVAAGGIIYAADINRLADGSITRPYVNLVQQVAQSLASSTDTPLTFGTGSENADTHGAHNETVNPSRITIPTGCGGRWRFEGMVFMAAPAAGVTYNEIRVSFFLNGTVQVPRSRPRGTGIAATQATGQGFAEFNVVDGDYVELNALQVQSTSGTISTNVGGSFASVFIAQRLRDTA